MNNDLLFPFRDKKIGVTQDPDHYRNIELASEVLIPLPPQHPGSFGFRRRFHVHEGVDLYCIETEPAYAMEGGVVVSIIPFTGEHAGSPWWHNTFAVLVEGDHGVINYGELIPNSNLTVGMHVKAGDHIGNITMVLLRDKGRPRSMLHLELYDKGSTKVMKWPVDAPQPLTLRDPTNLLTQAAGV